MDLNVNGQEQVRVLEYPENIRQKWGMYIDSSSTMLREAIDNATDEVLSCKTCNTVIIDTDFNGYNMVCDQGRGIPIYLSPDKPGRTQADVAVSTLHAGSKFVNADSKIGTYGIGVSATNALSSAFWVLSKITQENYDKSIPVVKSFYESLGPRSKKEIFYYSYYEKGYKVSEGAGKKSDLEKMIFGGQGAKILPADMSTIILFAVDQEIFPNQKATIPVENLQNFLFIQEKFYRRKVTIVANGEVLTAGNIKPYQFEILKTITPADISKNPYVGVYVTFEADPSLSPKKSTGSVNGLVVDNGVHIQYMEQCFEAALREEYKIKHKTIFPGLKMWVIMLVEDPVYDSQIKSRLRSISKVKVSDFQEIIKDFIKIFRKNEDYWITHVNKLNALAESYKSIGAVEKAQKMIDSATGNQAFKSKQEYVEGFSDATAHDRWNAELFLCFTGDTEMLTCNNEKISMVDLEKRVNSGEEIYTFSCKSDGTIIPAKVIAASKIKETDKLCKITLDNGESFTCTPNHKHMMRDGSYKESKDLKPGDSMMPCYITFSNNYDSEERRVVLDFGRVGERSYKSNSVSNNYGGKLIPIYRIMSEHADVNIDNSINDPNITINRHHIDKNKLNDSPRNILICSQEKHFSFHASENSIKLHEKAHQDESLYNKIYKENKNTEEFKKKASLGHKKYYESEEGEKMKSHLREKAVLEWKNEELLSWRSEETKKYFKDHPDKLEKILRKTKSTFYKNYVDSIRSYLKDNNIPLSSYWFNKVVLLKFLSKEISKTLYFETIKEWDKILLNDFNKDVNDSPKFVLMNIVLEELCKEGKELTESSFNEKLLEIFPMKNGKVSQGRGYRSMKKKYPEIISKYESILNNNHKIVSVEFINTDQKTPVYCLEVDTEEHNFPLAAGIFTKNCEGLSAAGGLKAGRKSTAYHAVLPLRGKILNVKDSTVDEALANKEIFTMLRVIGLGIDINNVTTGCQTPEEAYAKIQKSSRYGKVIIATDADSDGSHIQILILYLIAKYARFLIDYGLVYIAMSPLFAQNGNYYFQNDPLQPGTAFPVGLDPKKPFHRWKGWTSV